MNLIIFPKGKSLVSLNIPTGKKESKTCCKYFNYI